MILLQDPKVLFVHVPKTGGTSMTVALRKQGVIRSLGSMHSRYRSREGCWSFAFVRNPFERLVSYWMAMREGGRWNLSFEQFVKRLPRVRGKAYAKPMTRLIRCAATHREVDFVGRFEHMERDWGVVCEHLGVPPFALERRNTSTHGSYRDYYDAEAIRQVRVFCREDLERFEYDF